MVRADFGVVEYDRIIAARIVDRAVARAATVVVVVDVRIVRSKTCVLERGKLIADRVDVVSLSCWLRVSSTVTEFTSEISTVGRRDVVTDLDVEMAVERHAVLIGIGDLDDRAEVEGRDRRLVGEPEPGPPDRKSKFWSEPD